MNLYYELDDKETLNGLKTSTDKFDREARRVG